MNTELSYEEFVKLVKVAKCPLCNGRMSDDGVNSNMVFVDESGILYEYYYTPLKFPHNTVACENHHHFKVEDYKIQSHIPELDGVLRGWVLYEFEGIGK